MPKRCLNCRLPLYPNNLLGVCYRCRGRYRCNVCHATALSIRDRICPLCRQVTNRLDVLHNQDGPGRPFSPAHEARILYYQKRVELGLPLFDSPTPDEGYFYHAG